MNTLTVLNIQNITLFCCIQKTMPLCATWLGEGVQTACESGQDTSTVLRGRRIPRSLLSLHTLTATATLQDPTIFLRVSLSSMTTSTGLKSRLSESPSYDPRSTNHNRWIPILVGTCNLLGQGNSRKVVIIKLWIGWSICIYSLHCTTSC